MVRVRVGIVGFVTPGIPRWEIPEHYRGYEFRPIVDPAKKVIAAIRADVDLLVVITHSGLDRDPNMGAAPLDQMGNENAAWELANQVAGMNVFFYGHTHREMPQLVVNSVLMAQAKNWGQSLAWADVVTSHGAQGRWQVEAKHSRTIPLTPDVGPDEGITKLAAYYLDATERYPNTQIATSDKELTGPYGRYEDNPLVDLIHKVQLEAGHADVSMATMFFTGAKIPAGAATVRQAAELYVYENTL